jgi:hypothetical protein
MVNFAKSKQSLYKKHYISVQILEVRIHNISEQRNPPAGDADKVNLIRLWEKPTELTFFISIPNYGLL